MKKTNIGGQGVLEGVMMRSQTVSGLAVRKASGKINYTKEKITLAANKNKFVKLPFIRGVVSLVDMMGMGVKTLTKAAKMYDENSTEQEPSKLEKFIAKKTGKSAMDVAMVFAVIIALGLAVGIFFILPTVLANIVRPYIASSILMNLISGGIRLVIFVAYILAISFMKDIKRVYRYHGAEHKTISAYEHEEELTVDNVQKYKTLHPRCGTSYMLLVMVISILMFSLLGWSPSWYVRIGLRLAMLPIVAGISYEFLKFAARGENLFFRAIRWPGMQLQRLTTAQPDDSMVEVAILAFTAALDEIDDEELQQMADNFDRSPKKTEPSETEESEQEPSADTQENTAAAEQAQ
ncbi:MAG: DUF1385 domain-containing protein [Clostridia bacterium]|jgi:uncharacterized protein YqhQ|nr:DUF1385 domain-containing protein [Clostridia bacterium]MBT7121784.1 DUF1385 domain-containing protein [Clostridia bacterium]